MIQNLTPHPVILYRGEEIVETLLPSGVVPRAQQTDRRVGELEVKPGLVVDVVTTEYGAPSGLPEAQKGTYLVVSVLTAQAAKSAGRTTEDLLVPSDPVRSPDGKIIGCRRFARI